MTQLPIHASLQVLGFSGQQVQNKKNTIVVAYSWWPQVRQVTALQDCVLATSPGSRAGCTVRSNKPKHLGAVKSLLQGRAKRLWLRPQNPRGPRRFRQSIFKGKRREGA